MIITLTMNPAVDKTAEVDLVQSGMLHRISNVCTDAGGKGINVSKTIQSLGGESMAIGILAGNSGRFIQDSLDLLNIKNDFLYIDGNTRTNLKIIDKLQNLTEFNEEGPSPNVEQLKLLENTIIDLVHPNDIFVLSGSVPKRVDTNFYYKLIKLAKNKNAITILDADGELFKNAIEASPTIIKPNCFELLQFFKKDKFEDENELLFYAKSFLNKGIKMIVVSMGKEGSYFITEEKTIKVNPIKVKVHSSVGAGDAMVAALAYGIEQNYVLEDLICLCSAASSGAVITKGSKPADISLVNSLKKQVKYNCIE